MQGFNSLQACWQFSGLAIWSKCSSRDPLYLQRPSRKFWFQLKIKNNIKESNYTFNWYFYLYRLIYKQLDTAPNLLSRNSHPVEKTGIGLNLVCQSRQFFVNNHHTYKGKLLGLLHIICTGNFSCHEWSSDRKRNSFPGTNFDLK